MYDGIDSVRGHPYLEKDLPWGFAIYRCSYRDNKSWERMLREIEESVKEALEVKDHGRPDLLPSYQPVIFDDKEKFDGSTSHEIRDHFNVWVADQLPQVVAGPNILQRLHENSSDTLGPEAVLGQRWNFCVFVDDICLESLDHMTLPVVKLLYKQWGPLEPHERNYKVHPWWEDGTTEIDEEDVGWMYIDICSYVDSYNRLDESWKWHDEYLRPPSMVGLEDSESPGFWRKSKDEEIETEDSE
ncbi:hypothetical protein PHISP_08360 [Aspergillus sp. HF37]|nr:hypothetical protein PHISP_08360 [Aspergillus sp. HF37]